MHAARQGILGDIRTPKCPAAPSNGHEECHDECLPILRTVIESSERTMAVVGHSPSGKSRSEGQNVPDIGDGPAFIRGIPGRIAEKLRRSDKIK